MIPVCQRCGLSGEADRSVELTYSGLTALINLVIKKPKCKHCHTLHEENVGLPHSVQAARISS